MSDRAEFEANRAAGLKARHETRVERAREREAETLAAEVEPWLQECGSCDYALAMGCTCPKGDYRVVLLKVWQAYQAGRVLVAEEIAQAIEDLSRHDYRHDEFAVGVGAAAAKAREIGGAS